MWAVVEPGSYFAVWTLSHSAFLKKSKTLSPGPIPWVLQFSFGSVIARVYFPVVHTFFVAFSYFSMSISMIRR